MSRIDNEKSKPYRIPTPLIIKSTSPMTITNGKMTIVHSGNIIFHGDYVEFELEETRKESSIEQFMGRNHSTPLTSITQPLIIPSPDLPEGYKFLFKTEAKVSRGENVVAMRYGKETQTCHILQLFAEMVILNPCISEACLTQKVQYL